MACMPRPVEVVRSRANPSLKRVGAVRAGKEEALLLEGERLVGDALAGGHALDLLLVSEERASLLDRMPAREARLVEPRLLARVSALDTSPGVLALATRPPRRRVADLPRTEDVLLLVVHGVADPGNLGALARSAEAAGAAGLVVLAGGARPFGPKALRGSMGSLLRLPVAEEDEPGEVAAELTARGVRSVCAATRGGRDWRALDWSGPVALWVTAETGTPLSVDCEPVTVPLAGAVESLNVTVAASLLLFAAGRSG